MVPARCRSCYSCCCAGLVLVTCCSNGKQWRVAVPAIPVKFERRETPAETAETTVGFKCHKQGPFDLATAVKQRRTSIMS